ncbi:hypothetical protein KQI65_02320 [bacterium]|nr:hypothetical protein [bacterium]
MKLAIVGATLLMLCSIIAAAQDGEALVLRSCEGDVTITDNLLCVRGYEFEPVACVNSNLVCLRTADGSAEATLDLSKADTLCLTIKEGDVDMRMKCCWKRVLRGNIPLIENVQDKADAPRQLRSMIHRELGTLARN